MAMLLITRWKEKKVRSNRDGFEPIYGLSTWSLQEWLSRNPALRKDYEAKLRAYGQLDSMERHALERWENEGGLVRN